MIEKTQMLLKDNNENQNKIKTLASAYIVALATPSLINVYVS